MNPFIRNIFSSCLGFGLALFLLGFLSILLVAGLASAGEQAVVVQDNSILYLTLDKPVPEQTDNIELDPFNLMNQKTIGLHEICKTLNQAAADERIKGIYLDLDQGLDAGMATAATLREAILRFKESGKFVVAYAKSYSQGSYYLASAADTVCINPMGTVDFQGFAVMIPFFKTVLDKVGIKMQIFYAGEFKSATEPYRLTKMSEQNRLQLRAYLDPVYNDYLTRIGESRKKSMVELKEMANELKIRNAKDALAYGLVDRIAYADEVLAELKKRLGLNEEEKLKSVTLEQYALEAGKKPEGTGRSRVAVVYAEGNILEGDGGGRGTITDNKYLKILRKLREDDKVKAIVLRVNSPGGSALASENIWRELSLARQAGKKIVVSMGDYAASGGYYISCMADHIVAEPNTLTGSIGVFSILPNVSTLMEEKIGITWDSVKTAKYATGLNPFFELSAREQEVLQQSTEEVYEKFLERVAEGRKMSRDSVHAIARGRIWTGEKAREIGLVDEIGDLESAIQKAASMAGLDEYKVQEYPYQKEPVQEFLEELTGQKKDDDVIRQQLLRKELGETYEYYVVSRQILEMKGVQARLPVLITFK
jgi:protease-4